MRLRQITFALTLIDLPQFVLDVRHLIGPRSIEGRGRLVVVQRRLILAAQDMQIAETFV